MYILRGAMPMAVMAEQAGGWLGPMIRAFGSWLVREVPYHELYFLAQASIVRDAVRMPLVYIGGVTSAAGIAKVLDAGFDAVAMARALIHDPNFVNRLEADEAAAFGVQSLQLLRSAHLRDAHGVLSRQSSTRAPRSFHSPGEDGLTRGAVAPNSKTALVTGACSGIGLALRPPACSARLSAGAREPACRTSGPGCTEIEAAHRVETLPLVLDLARRDAAAELAQELRDREIDVEVLINNAGMFFFGEAADADPERAANLLELHVVTPSLLVTHFAPGMRSRGSGHILFVSSISAFKDFPGISYYGASKKYLLGFARALRSELGLHGVTVTCLAPGPVDTALYDTEQSTSSARPPPRYHDVSRARRSRSPRRLIPRRRAVYSWTRRANPHARHAPLTAAADRSSTARAPWLRR